IFYLILYETRPDVILSKRAKKIRKQTGRLVYSETELAGSHLWENMRLSFERPTRMLVTEPVVAFFTLWIAFAWGILFLFFSSVVQTFRTNYGMNNLQTGTVQLAISVGALVGLI